MQDKGRKTTRGALFSRSPMGIIGDLRKDSDSFSDFEQKPTDGFEQFEVNELVPREDEYSKLGLDKAEPADGLVVSGPPRIQRHHHMRLEKPENVVMQRPTPIEAEKKPLESRQNIRGIDYTPHDDLPVYDPPDYDSEVIDESSEQELNSPRQMPMDTPKSSKIEIFGMFRARPKSVRKEFSELKELYSYPEYEESQPEEIEDLVQEPQEVQQMGGSIPKIQVYTIPSLSALRKKEDLSELITDLHTINDSDELIEQAEQPIDPLVNAGIKTIKTPISLKLRKNQNPLASIKRSVGIPQRPKMAQELELETMDVEEPEDFDSEPKLKILRNPIPSNELVGETEKEGQDLIDIESQPSYKLLHSPVNLKLRKNENMLNRFKDMAPSRHPKAERFPDLRQMVHGFDEKHIIKSPLALKFSREETKERKNAGFFSGSPKEEEFPVPNEKLISPMGQKPRLIKSPTLLKLRKHENQLEYLKSTVNLKRPNLSSNQLSSIDDGRDSINESIALVFAPLSKPFPKKVEDSTITNFVSKKPRAHVLELDVVEIPTAKHLSFPEFATDSDTSAIPKTSSTLEQIKLPRLTKPRMLGMHAPSHQNPFVSLFSKKPQMTNNTYALVEVPRPTESVMPHFIAVSSPASSIHEELLRLEQIPTKPEFCPLNQEMPYRLSQRSTNQDPISENLELEQITIPSPINTHMPQSAQISYNAPIIPKSAREVQLRFEIVQIHKPQYVSMPHEAEVNVFSSLFAKKPREVNSHMEIFELQTPALLKMNQRKQTSSLEDFFSKKPREQFSAMYLLEVKKPILSNSDWTLTLDPGHGELVYVELDLEQINIQKPLQIQMPQTFMTDDRSAELTYVELELEMIKPQRPLMQNLPTIEYPTSRASPSLSEIYIEPITIIEPQLCTYPTYGRSQSIFASLFTKKPLASSNMLSTIDFEDPIKLDMPRPDFNEICEANRSDERLRMSLYSTDMRYREYTGSTKKPYPSPELEFIQTIIEPIDVVMPNPKNRTSTLIDMFTNNKTSPGVGVEYLEEITINNPLHVEFDSFYQQESSNPAADTMSIELELIPRLFNDKPLCLKNQHSYHSNLHIHKKRGRLKPILNTMQMPEILHANGHMQKPESRYMTYNLMEVPKVSTPRYTRWPAYYSRPLLSRILKRKPIENMKMQQIDQGTLHIPRLVNMSIVHTESQESGFSLFSKKKKRIGTSPGLSFMQKPQTNLSPIKIDMRKMPEKTISAPESATIELNEIKAKKPHDINMPHLESRQPNELRYVELDLNPIYEPAEPKTDIKRPEELKLDPSREIEDVSKTEDKKHPLWPFNLLRPKNKIQDTKDSKKVTKTSDASALGHGSNSGPAKKETQKRQKHSLWPLNIEVGPKDGDDKKSKTKISKLFFGDTSQENKVFEDEFKLDPELKVVEPKGKKTEVPNGQDIDQLAKNISRPEWTSIYIKEMTRPLLAESCAKDYFSQASLDQKNTIYALSVERMYWGYCDLDKESQAYKDGHALFTKTLENSTRGQRKSIENSINLTKALRSVAIFSSPNQDRSQKSNARAILRSITTRHPELKPLVYYQIARLGFMRAFSKNDLEPGAEFDSFISELDSEMLIHVFAYRASFFDGMMNDLAASEDIRKYAAKNYAQILMHYPKVSTLLDLYMSVHSGLDIFFTMQKETNLQKQIELKEKWQQIVYGDSKIKSILYYEIASIMQMHRLYHLPVSMGRENKSN